MNEKNTRKDSDELDGGWTTELPPRRPSKQDGESSDLKKKPELEQERRGAPNE